MHAIHQKLCHFGLAGAMLLGVGQRATAQTAVSDQTVAQELRDLASHASLIFVGQIVGIQRQAGFVTVTFRVEQPVSGNAGPNYALREWAGLWPAGYSRYTVGARVLAFLHGASAAGAGSPVHGAEGLIPVLVRGADAPELLDVRRVAASVVRAPGVSLPTAEGGAIPLQEAILAFEGAGPGSKVSFSWQGTGLRAHLPEALQPNSPLRRATTATSVQAFQPSRTGGSIHVAR